MQSKLVIVGLLGIGASAVGAIVFFGNQQTSAGSHESEVSSIENRQLAFDSSQAAMLADETKQMDIEQRTPQQSDQTAKQQGLSFDNIMARMSEFDADGDGILSKEERDEMRKAIRKERMEKMDLDGDGKISREERQLARQERFEQSTRGQELMRRFDLDGNGVLNADEQAALDAYNQEQREARQADQLAKYDLDGDGELSADERQAQRDEQRARFENLREQATLDFDRDGDGQLSIEEQQDAMNAYRAQREIERFINQFDTDGDGQMGAADYDSFANDFANGDLRADVNHDGVVDTADLAAYRDMVTQSQNN